MTDKDGEFSRDQKIALQRLAALQRMREEAKRGNRAAMLDSVDKLIALETRMLRDSRSKDAKPS